jgi:hypothetical protein
VIHELRTYAVQPGRLAEYVDKSGAIGRPIRGDRFGKLVGYFTTELGPLNRVVHFWEYEDLAARTAARAGLAQEPRWTQEYLPVSGPLLQEQDNTILVPVEWYPLRPSSGMGVYELRVYRLHPGRLPAYLQAFREALPVREKHSAPVGVWTVEIGALNSVVALWPYRDLAHRAAVRAGAAADPRWQAAVGQLAPLMQRQDATVLVPTPFSPWR